MCKSIMLLNHNQMYTNPSANHKSHLNSLTTQSHDDVESHDVDVLAPIGGIDHYNEF